MIMQDGWTALLEASRNGHSDVVNRLLECKQIDVNLQAKVSRVYGSSIVFIIFASIYLWMILLFFISI